MEDSKLQSPAVVRMFLLVYIFAVGVEFNSTEDTIRGFCVTVVLVLLIYSGRENI